MTWIKILKLRLDLSHSMLKADNESSIGSIGGTETKQNHEARAKIAISWNEIKWTKYWDDRKFQIVKRKTCLITYQKIPNLIDLQIISNSSHVLFIKSLPDLDLRNRLLNQFGRLIDNELNIGDSWEDGVVHSTLIQFATEIFNDLQIWGLWLH